MQPPDPQTITQMLQNARGGEDSAFQALLPVVYSELGALAERLFSSERRDHTLQPTALIHEAWMKLVGHIDAIEDRTHFFAIASQAMRQVLIDHARGRSRLKRGGHVEQVTLSDSLNFGASVGIDLVDLDDMLTHLTTLNPRHGRVVELRIFGGLTIAETASFLDVSDTTVERDWLMAKAWLRTKLGDS
ncbi:MAG: sigma-70 family RNA polymerase sigma factor [Planctomycetes bacterium]|nr:sigma-70 family RNA polymerase sigma factor [Planctomycetota bacterium]